MILLFLCHGQENLVGRGVKGQRIAVFSEGFPQFVSCPDGGISDVEVEIIREEGIELEPGYKPLARRAPCCLMRVKKCEIRPGSGRTTASPNRAPHFVPPM